MKVPRIVAKRFRSFLRTTPVLGPLRLDRVVSVEQGGPSIENHRLLLPAQKIVPFDVSENDLKFLNISKYFREGSYSRPDVFACEIPNAFYHNGTGLVCTSDFDAIGDSQMEYRLPWCKPFNWFKPIRVKHMPGAYATINNTFWKYWWHWLADCLPRIYCLQKAYPDQKITLLMPAEMGASFRDSLASVLPRNFEVKYLPSNSWVKVDRMLLPSYVSTRANGHLPAEFCEFIRRQVFDSFLLPYGHQQSERIYVSRSKAKYRRILNEKPLMGLLEAYGFRSVRPEELPFREQVELFHRAEVVVSAHGSNWGNILFSGKIKILVLYPDQKPNTHIYTLAKALGQEHFFLAGNEPSENSDFSVDLAAVENVLSDEMNLRRIS